MRHSVLCLLAFLLSRVSANADVRPNVVFIEVDDLTDKYIGAFGAEHIRTPNIDALAKRGVLFRNAIVQGCMCAPSRNSLITARYPQNLGLYSNGDVAAMPPERWAFPVALQEAGVHTSWIGKSHLLPYVEDQQGRGGDKKTAGMKQRMGFDEVWQSAGRHVALKKAKDLASDPTAKWQRGVDAYADYLHDKGLLAQFLEDGANPTTLAVDDYLDGLIARMSADWIAAYDRPEPFFLWVNFSGPHGPYNPPAKYLELYPPRKMPVAIRDEDHSDIPDCLRPHEWTKREQLIPRQRAEYAGMITFMDEQVGRVLDAVQSKGIAEQTVIVFFSDHGIMEGDHGLVHKETLYKEVLNACLIVADPQGEQGKRVERPVELLDLVRTTLDFAGVKPPAQQPAFGESLLPLLRGRDAEYRRDFAVAQVREATAIVTHGYKYIETASGPVLFDRQADSDELENIAASQPERCRELQAKLDMWRAEHGPVIPPPAERRGNADE